MTSEQNKSEVLSILFEVACAANKCGPGDCYFLARDVMQTLQRQLQRWDEESSPEEQQHIWTVYLDMWVYETNNSNGDACRLNKIASIKALREASTLLSKNEIVMGLKVAKDLVESSNRLLFAGVTKSVADSIVVTLAAHGVKAHVEGGFKEVVKEV